MTYDVAVIGGGLAGPTAAITLARQGARVALYEAKTYPHHKVCGEFLSPECAEVLDDLGVTPTLPKNLPTMTFATLTTPSGAVWQSDLPAPALGLSRYALDAALADRMRAVGVDLFERATVTRIDGTLGGGFRLHVRGMPVQSAQVVIGAYGKRANLDRALSRPFLRRRQPFVGLKAHFDGPPVPRRVELHTFDGGYCGLSEIEGGRINACLLVRQAKLTGSPDDFAAWMAAQNPALGAWMRSAERLMPWLSIAQVPFVRKRVVESDVLMTGDAAGLIAPLAGDGMGMALRGGQLVADFVSHYLDVQPDRVALVEGYAAAWRQQFGGRLRLARLLQALLLRPSLVEPGVRVVNRLPALGQYFVTHTREGSNL